MAIAKETTMVLKNPLKTILLVDAGITGVNALAYLLIPKFLEKYLGYPSEIQLSAGLFLLIFTILVLIVAQRTPISRTWVKEIIIVNTLWVVASIIALFSGVLDATMTGGVWVVLQAAVVAGFAGLQSWWLRQS